MKLHPTPRYFAELDAATHYSFLEGASYPAELVQEARRLGLAALGVADRNSLAGIVRAWQAGTDERFPVLTGCRLRFTDGAELIVYARDRAGYGRLCRLLSIGKAELGMQADAIPGERIAKGDPRPSLEERYPSHAAYVARVKAQADKLVAQRYMLAADAARIVREADAAKVP